MQYKINKEDSSHEAKMITIFIGENTYRLQETKDGQLKINETSWQKIEDKFYVWHIEGDTKTLIAITDDEEKANSFTIIP